MHCRWTRLSVVVFSCYSNHKYFPFQANIYDRCAVKEAHPSYKSKPIIICGDLNVAATALDIKNPKANIHNAGFTEERSKFKDLLDSGYVDTFRYLHPEEVKYSWWSYMFYAREKNAGWRLDYLE